MIDSFRGDNAFLSNFFEAPVRYDGRQYGNSESAYQAAKFKSPEHDPIREQFETTTGKEAKQLVKRYQIAFRRVDWKQVNLAIMAEIVHAKFTQNKTIRLQLVNSFPHDIIECNTWHDYWWGICKGTGKNWLGRILMAERMYWIDLMAHRSWESDDQKNLGVVALVQSAA